MKPDKINAEAMIATLCQLYATAVSSVVMLGSYAHQKIKSSLRFA